MLITHRGALQLKYTYNALVEYEEKFGRPLLLDAKSATQSVIRRLVWAGLLHYPKGYSVQEAGNLIEEAIENGADLIDIKEEIAKAIDDSVFLQRLVEKSAKRQAQNKAQESNCSA